jgi:hypothetical protein
VKIWLDDEREAPEGWHRCYSPHDCIVRILFGAEKVTEVSLDHDLGEDCGNGYDVLVALEQAVEDDMITELPIIHIHTANPPARVRMEAAVRSIQAAAERNKEEG